VETCFGHQAQAFSSNSPQSVYLFHDSLQLILQRMNRPQFPGHELILGSVGRGR
jgi:hypothetical protein